MIGLALSGGGSRAMAFHLGCLRALEDIGLLERIDVLSTISGGSVIGAYYAYTPGKPFAEFEADIRCFLKAGFQRGILTQLCKPRNLGRCLMNVTSTNLDALAERVLRRPPKFRGFPSRTDLFQDVLTKSVFGNLKMSATRRRLEVVIGVCDLRTGSAFRFGNAKTGSWRLGEMISGDVDVALAVAASAAYPFLLPALDRKWKFRKNGNVAVHRILLSDGGIYDNLGVQVLEPGRDPAFSIHTFPCDYIIACNAGHGQASGESLPVRLFPRIVTSFAIVHRRVQDAAMHRLHQLRQSNVIKGFALPYLGQQDSQLPLQPSALIPRSEVIQYPTNFSAMSEQWINKLSDRGEQLTRVLVSHYLGNLLEQC